MNERLPVEPPIADRRFSLRNCLESFRRAKLNLPPMPLFLAGTMFDRRVIRWLLGLIVLAAGGLYLVGNQRVPLWDRDEPRYAQTSRQMLASGDWVVPRLLDEIRTAKP